MSLSVQQGAFVAGILFLDASSTIDPADGAHIAGVYPYDFTGAVPPEPEVPAVSTGGAGGWHGDHDFRLRSREKKKRPEIVPLEPAASDIDVEIVALLMMAGY